MHGLSLSGWCRRSSVCSGQACRPAGKVAPRASPAEAGDLKRNQWKRDTPLSSLKKQKPNMETSGKANTASPFLLQVLPPLQTPWPSAGRPSSAPLSGGHPHLAAGGWDSDHLPPQQQRWQGARAAEGSESPGQARAGGLHSHHADAQQDGPAAAAAEPLPGAAAAAQSDRGVEQRGGEGARGRVGFSGAAPCPRGLQTADNKQDEKSAPGLPWAGDRGWVAAGCPAWPPACLHCPDESREG